MLKLGEDEVFYYYQWAGCISETFSFTLYNWSLLWLEVCSQIFPHTVSILAEFIKSLLLFGHKPSLLENPDLCQDVIDETYSIVPDS